MNLKKSLEISLLNEFYGTLLTEKQKNFLTDYYDNNMSLAEIAENASISRQAVRDSLLKSEKTLLKYESNLGLLKKYNFFKTEIESLIRQTEEGLKKQELTKKLKGLIDFWEVN